METENDEVNGYFDGQSMVGNDGDLYPIPPNYSSKCNLVYGDELSMINADNGCQMFKQVKQAKRSRFIAEIIIDGGGDKVADHDDKTYRILNSCISFWKLKDGDRVAIVTSKNYDSEWCSVEYKID